MTISTNRVLEPVIHVYKLEGSPLHPLRHCALVYGQHRSIDLPLSLSDIPALDKLSLVIVSAVFDLLLSAMDRSLVDFPSVIEDWMNEVFGNS